MTAYKAVITSSQRFQRVGSTVAGASRSCPEHGPESPTLSHLLSQCHCCRHYRALGLRKPHLCVDDQDTRTRCSRLSSESPSRLSRIVAISNHPEGRRRKTTAQLHAQSVVKGSRGVPCNRNRRNRSCRPQSNAAAGRGGGEWRESTATVSDRQTDRLHI